MNFKMNGLRVISVLAFALLVGACSKQEDSKQAVASESVEASGQGGGTAGSENVDEALKVTLQGGEFSHRLLLSLRYDREKLTTKTKVMQRQVLIEAGPGTPDEILTQLAAEMTGIGYRAGKVTEQEDGFRQNFRKDGVDLVRIRILPRGEGPNLRDPAATASVYITETPKTTK